MVEKVTVPCPRCNAKLRMPVYVRPGKKPKCPRCGSVVRPEQVLIPENLPTEKIMSELHLPSLPDAPLDEHELADEPPHIPPPPVGPARPISSLDETFVPTPERPSPLPPHGLRETILPAPPDPSRRRPPSAPSTPDVRRPPSAPDIRATELPPERPLRETDVPRNQPLRETDFVPRPGLPPPASLPPAMAPSAPSAPALPASAAALPITPPYDPAGSSADFDDPNKPPPEVPGFQILAPLGRGANGVVYRVRQAGLKRDAALKMLLGGQYVDPAARARFLVEAEAAAQLRHPGVVQVYVYGEFDEQPYLCMEYVDGGTLGRKLRRGGVLAPGEAAGLMAQVADAVAHAHAAKIVHRDLKPANILLTMAGLPKVTDFGLAKQMDATDPASTGMLIGSPSYMSPEQASGQVKKVGPASDVFALGAILYECLAGRPPFRGETMLDTLRMAVNEDPVPLRELSPGVPRSLETICMKCLAKDPPDRYPTAAELAADLHRWERGEPIQAKPPRPVERARAWVRRHPRRVAATAGGVLLVVLVAALLFAV